MAAPFSKLVRGESRQPLRTGLAIAVLAAAVVISWPWIGTRLLSTDFLPHLYCYLRNPALIWTHVVADSLIGVAYFAISATLAYLVYKARRDIPFHWMFLAFGLFIVACGGTHFCEVVTVWIPVYVLAATVKVFTAAASLATAAVLPVTIPRVLTLVQQAKVSEQVTAQLRASEERKEALLREVNHRVKNNLAVICSLLYLQSTHTDDEGAIQTFRDMENRVYSMALVHQSLYTSENLARIDFATYAQTLAQEILSSHSSPGVPVHLKCEFDKVIMGVDSAIPCALILNELISNALKHGFAHGADGELDLTLRIGPQGQCLLRVRDNGVGISEGLNPHAGKSLGLKLVRSLTRQLGGSFELANSDSGTSATLTFTVNQHVC